MCVCVSACVFLLTCGLHQLRVQTVRDQWVGQVGEESLQRSGSGVHRHVHHHEVDTVIYEKEKTKYRQFEQEFFYNRSGQFTTSQQQHLLRSLSEVEARYIGVKPRARERVSDVRLTTCSLPDTSSVGSMIQRERKSKSFVSS